MCNASHPGQYIPFGAAPPQRRAYLETVPLLTGEMPHVEGDHRRRPLSSHPAGAAAWPCQSIENERHAMTAAAGSSPDGGGPLPAVQSWLIVGQAAAALAAGMGIGRFAYTAILPLMHAQASLSPQLGAELATANYIGYLAGAIAAIAAPALVRSRLTFRLCLLVLIGTLALMPATHIVALWLGLRLVAGVASALIFVIAVSGLLTGLRTGAQHLIGWAFGGVGAGIALSGVVVLTVSTIGTWQLAWWSAAALAAACTVPAWWLSIGWPTDRSAAATHGDVRASGLRWFGALLASYSLEGIGYIIAGTFLVAAIDQTGPDWAGSGAWIVVGLAALPSSALWARLSDTWSRPTLLLTALIVQAIGIALPAFAGGVVAALASATLFGATFLGVAALALAIGAHLQVQARSRSSRPDTASGRSSARWPSPRCCTTAITKRCASARASSHLLQSPPARCVTASRTSSPCPWTTPTCPPSSAVSPTSRTHSGRSG